MTQDHEWHGEPHKLIVHSVEPRDPALTFDLGEMECDIEHLPSCPEIELWDGVTDENCELGWLIRDVGLPEALDYSGSVITQPGTYTIRSWGRKYYNWEFGWEYDAGIEIIDPDEEDKP